MLRTCMCSGSKVFSVVQICSTMAMLLYLASLYTRGPRLTPEFCDITGFLLEVGAHIVYISA